jgi:hypothetical protein
MNDLVDEYDYPERVCFEIPQEDLKSYLNAAEFLNLQNIDLVCLQHEFGIFGGQAGSHILALLRGLRMPVVTTLHTVSHKPRCQPAVGMLDLALSDRLVVMSERSSIFARDL